MRAIFVLAMLIQVTESPVTDELGRVRGLRAEDPANGRLAAVGPSETPSRSVRPSRPPQPWPIEI